MPAGWLVAMCPWALLVAPAQGAPLFLDLFDFPDIASGFIDVTYTANTDTFLASGFALEIDDDGVGPAIPVQNGTFDLTATIDDAGSLGPGGTLAIGGTVPSLGFNSGTLLLGDLTAFGFPIGGGDPLEFGFDVTGGDAAGLYSTRSGRGGVILSFTGFGGLFTQDFDNLISGNAGTGTAVVNVEEEVPLPGALHAGLMVLGLLGLFSARKELVRRADRMV